MKKWFLIVSSIILITVLGTGMITLHGHGQRNYNSCVRLARSDVADGNYRDALNYYQDAQKVDSEKPQARNDLDQVQSYVNGNYYFDHYKFREAAKNYRRSVKIGALATLNRRSMLKYKRVNMLQNDTHWFTSLYDQALVLNHRHDFKSSVRCLDKIMNDPNVNLGYFKSFRVRVMNLIKTDHHGRRSTQTTSDVKSAQNDNDEFKLKAPRIVTDHPSKVTIAKARREIKQAGINVREMSNQDVANLIRQARKHHVSIYRYAKNNY